MRYTIGILLLGMGAVSLIENTPFWLFLFVATAILIFILNHGFGFPHSKLDGLKFIEEMIKEGDEILRLGDKEGAIRRWKAVDYMLDAYNPANGAWIVKLFKMEGKK